MDIASSVPAVQSQQANQWALAVTVLLLRRSMLTEKIARRGQHITREYGVDPYELARIGEVMARSVDRLAADLPIADAIRVLEAGQHRSYPVVDPQDRPIGMVSRVDALAWRHEEAMSDDTIADRVSDASMPVLHPGDVVARAVDLMLATDQGRIAVTDPGSGALVGLVARKDLLRVRAATAASEEERHAFYKRPGHRSTATAP